MKKLEIGVGQYVAISAATMLTGVVIGAYASNKMHVKQTKKEEGTADAEMPGKVDKALSEWMVKWKNYGSNSTDAGMTDKEIDDINQHIDRIQKEIDEDARKFGNL